MIEPATNVAGFFVEVDMREQPLPIALDYAADPQPRRVEQLLMKPFPYWVAMPLLGLALWKFVVGIADPTLLLFRPLFHVFYAGIWVTLFGSLVVVHSIIGASLRRKYRIANHSVATWRGWILFVVTIGALGLHMSAIPLRVAFWFHKGKFETARQTILATIGTPQLPEAVSEGRHPPIGPFPVRIVRISARGEVAFWEGDGAVGGGVVYSPDGSEPDPLFYPPDDTGRLDANWFWFTTD